MYWRRLLALPVILSAVWVAAAVAQEAPPPAAAVADEVIPDLPPEGSEAPPAAAPAEEPPPAPSAAKPQVSEAAGRAPDAVRIQQGDTLWDVCLRFLDNPWYWPKLWSLNQYIGNPNVIYPGDELRFYSGGVYELPKLEINKAQPPAAPEPETPKLAVAKPGVETEPAVEERAIDEEKEAALPAPASAEVPAVTASDTVETAPAAAAPAAAGKEAPKSYLTRSNAFISKEKMDGAGIVLSSFEDKHMLSNGDRVYLQLKTAKGVSPGDQFLVFEVVKKVPDPHRLFGKIGYQIQIKGSAEVDEIKPGSVAARITDSSADIARGDYVMRAENLYKEITPSRMDKHLTGSIVGSEKENYLIGQGDTAFVNLGLETGVKDGHELFVVRRKDGLDDDSKELPFVVVGRMLVLSVKKGSCSALVTETSQPLEIGDTVRTFP